MNLGLIHCSSRLVRVLLGTLWSSVKQIEAAYLFHWENAIALDTMQGNRASSLREGKVHTVKGFGVVNKAEVDVFLELSCFLDDPTDVGNLISGSSAFSKSSLNIWKFMVHILLKPDLENFEHYFASM